VHFEVQRRILQLGVAVLGYIIDVGVLGVILVRVVIEIIVVNQVLLNSFCF
jgi:hypothetical protein